MQEIQDQIELKRLRKKWERLLDAVPAMVFFKDRKNRFIQVNSAYAEAVGLSKREIIGKSVADFTSDPKMATAYWEDDREVIESGRPKRNITTTHITDSQRWLRTEKFPFYNDAGKIVGVAGLSVDISEMKRTEAELDSRVRQQKAVADIGQLALSGADCDHLFDDAAEMVSRVLSVDYCLILEFLDDDDGYRLRAYGGKKALCQGVLNRDEPSCRFRCTVPLDMPMMIFDTNEERHFRDAFPLLKKLGIVNSLMVSIGQKSNHFGLIGAHVTQQRRFSQTDIDFLQNVGNMLALSVEREKADQAVLKTTWELRNMSSKLIKAQEEERHRIFRALHDELGQSLALLRLQIRSVQMKLEPAQDALREDCEQTLKYISGIIKNVRRLCHDLTPAVLEDLGLNAALRWLFEEFSRYFNFEFSVELDNVDHIFRRDAQLMIYRIFQEALNNVYKHANASRVHLTMKRTPEAVRCEVADNGKGMTLARVRRRQSPADGFGLVTMGERARMLGGQLDVETRPGCGTCIRLTIPIIEKEK
ncbi:PAS domain-containing protein [Desulfosarcina widdelii]|uniref:PAS domain-containing protein n=1 Tax=Desulfosarcina widdelii TaxID=947919 RepID=UPI0012D2CD47|nr:PAS domain-containing protein [Desulfosarcina widdelii]